MEEDETAEIGSDKPEDEETDEALALVIVLIGLAVPVMLAHPLFAIGTEAYVFLIYAIKYFDVQQPAMMLWTVTAFGGGFIYVYFPRLKAVAEFFLEGDSDE